MRNFLIWATMLLLALLVGFAAGWYLHQTKHGYYYEVRDETRTPFLTGTVTRKYVTESIGIPFLDPGTSILELANPSGADSVVIYKAKRGFQEDHPFVETISVNGNTVIWDDGQSKYELTVTAHERDGKTSQDK